MPNVLTDGTGISGFTVPKLIKDLIADALVGAAAGFASINVITLPQDKAQAIIAFWVVANAVAHSLFRAILKWTQS
jgi:hypothetical protein